MKKPNISKADLRFYYLKQRAKKADKWLWKHTNYILNINKRIEEIDPKGFQIIGFTQLSKLENPTHDYEEE